MYLASDVALKQMFSTTFLSSFGTSLNENCVFIYIYILTTVAQWLRCCATNWKVAGLIPGGVIGVFH